MAVAETAIDTDGWRTGRTGPAPAMRSEDLRTQNRFRLIDTLRHHGACTRTRLARLTGLSAAAVSTLTRALATEGIVTSTRRQPGSAQRRGRPEYSVELVPQAALVITVALTIDLLRMNVLRYDGSVAFRIDTSLDTRACSRQALTDLLTSRIDECLDASPATRLMQIGVGFQGMTAHHNGSLVWSPILGLASYPIREILSHRYGVPVSVNNDCRLIAHALHARQYTRLGSHFVTILFSYGIGMALHVNHQAFSGVRTSAMEIGHLPHRRGGARCRCGLQGCIEAYAADYAIVRHADGLSELTPPAGRVPPGRLSDVVSRARSGEPLALAAFDRAGAAVGEGLAMLFRLLDPMPVALVGQVAAGLTLMQTAMQRSLDATLDYHCPLDGLAHRFDDEDDLLQAGLALDALSSIDRRLAVSDCVSDTAPA